MYSTIFPRYLVAITKYTHASTHLNKQVLLNSVGVVFTPDLCPYSDPQSTNSASQQFEIEVSTGLIAHSNKTRNCAQNREVFMNGNGNPSLD